MALHKINLENAISVNYDMWVFPVVMYGCESWTVKRASAEELMLLNCGVGEDSWESLGLKRDPTSLSKGNQSWLFIGRTDAEMEAPVLWPPNAKNWLTGKDPDAGKDWRWEEKGMTKDEMVGWHYWLDGHEFEQALGVGDGQGSLACCSPWGRKESDTTEQLNWKPCTWDVAEEECGDKCRVICPACAVEQDEWYITRASMFLVWKWHKY